MLTYPLIGFDEVLLNDAGLQLATYGRFRADVLSLNPGFDSQYFWQPPGLPLCAALFYKLFGFGIWQTRLPSILFGGLAVWAIFALVRHLRPSGIAASIAALSLFLLPQWMLTAKTSRMDAPAILSLLLATSFFVRAIGDEAKAVKRIFLAGFCVGIATMFHTASIPWAAALGIVVLVFSSRRFRSMAAFCAGCGFLIAGWLVYAATFPEQFHEQYLTHLTARTASEDLAVRLVGHAQRYWLEYAGVATLVLPAALAVYGLSHGRIRTERALQALLALTALVAGLTAVVVGGRTTGYYTLYPMALLFCVMAIGIEDAMAAPTSIRGRRTAMTISALCLLAFEANAMMLSIAPRVAAFAFQGKERDYKLQMSPLARVLKPGDQVWGRATTWFAVVDAGARLQVFDWIAPFQRRTRPDPSRHVYVVLEPGDSFEGSEAYEKIGEFGTPLPRVLGSTLSDRSYVFEFWKSKIAGN